MWKAITIAVLATLAPKGSADVRPEEPVEYAQLETADATHCAIPTLTDVPALKVSF
jgi:hypothetical protein